MQIYHRLFTPSDPDEEAKVRRSGALWGKPKRAIKGNWKAKVKAFIGPLPSGMKGYAFTTQVSPSGSEVYGGRDGCYWLEDDPGVFDVPNQSEYVGIEVEVIDNE